MSEDIKLIPYKEIIKKKSLDYYYANRDAICKKNRKKYSILTPEQKRQDRQEYKKCWYKKELEKKSERKQEIKQKKSEYNKNRYDNGTYKKMILYV